ncbi:hypothetical protein EV683_11376 [Crenobacter luteus]|nr:hypothetical protein EV683_11376 [Crenobacter luteus]
MNAYWGYPGAGLLAIAFIVALSLTALYHARHYAKQL